MLLAAAILAAGCRHGARGVQSAPTAVQSAPTTATLVPTDLALAFLQQIKSQPGAALAGESMVPACQFTEKGAWSGGEYRKLTGQQGPRQITAYPAWALFKIEDGSGREFGPSDLGKPGAWSYALRTPRTARTVFGISDHCNLGPSEEPTRKVVEALSALGVEVAAYSYIAR